jgi:hypothetical protein
MRLELPFGKAMQRAEKTPDNLLIGRAPGFGSSECMSAAATAS